MNSSKTFESKAKDFNWLGWAIIGFSLMLVLINININSIKSIIASSIYTVLGIVLGFLFIKYGNIKRKIIISDEKVEYYNKKLSFTVKIEDIILIKSFQDVNKTTSELVILTENETYTVSSAFFEKSVLKQCFRELCNVASSFENIKIEDDRLWLED